MSSPAPQLYLITDRQQLPAGRDLVETVEQALEAGVRRVQLREKDLSAAQLWPLAQQLRQLTRRYRAQLLINDRIDLALAVDADGVHLGGQSLPVEVGRQLLGLKRLIGLSTHSLDEVSTAAKRGADFVTFGPVFFTPSKAAYGHPQGLELLQQACQSTSLPVFALGGIKSHQVAEVISHGASGIALISAILAAADPAAASRQLLNQLPSAPPSL